MVLTGEFHEESTWFGGRNLSAISPRVRLVASPRSRLPSQEQQRISSGGHLRFQHAVRPSVSHAEPSCASIRETHVRQLPFFGAELELRCPVLYVADYQRPTRTDFLGKTQVNKWRNYLGQTRSFNPLAAVLIPIARHCKQSCIPVPSHEPHVGS